MPRIIKCKNCQTALPQPRERLTVPVAHSTLTLNVSVVGSHDPVALCQACLGACLRLALRGLYERHPESKPKRGRPKAHAPDCRCQACKTNTEPPMPVEEEGESESEPKEKS